MLRPRLICVKHLGHRLRLSLAHHATIATAAARGSPPAGMSSGEPSATAPRGRPAIKPRLVAGSSVPLQLCFSITSWFSDQQPGSARFPSPRLRPGAGVCRFRYCLRGESGARLYSEEKANMTAAREKAAEPTEWMKVANTCWPLWPGFWWHGI